MAQQWHRGFQTGCRRQTPGLSRRDPFVSPIVQTMLGTVVDPSRLRRLFDETDGPIVGLRTRHPAWFVPHGKLARFSIAAAHKMTRRAFDSLYYPNLVAVGVFKVFMSSTDYLVELHQIVAGAEKFDLSCSLSRGGAQFFTPPPRTAPIVGAHSRRQDPKTPVEQALMRGLGTA